MIAGRRPAPTGDDGDSGGAAAAKRTRVTASTQFPHAAGKAAEALEWAAECKQLGTTGTARVVLSFPTVGDAPPGRRMAAVTVNMLREARYRRVDNDGMMKVICYLVGNRTTDVVRCVGVLRDVVVTTTLVTAKLDDGTGTINVTCYVIGEPGETNNFDQLKEGTFVRVHGRPTAQYTEERGAAPLPAVHMFKVEVVSDADEIPHHFLQAMLHWELLSKTAVHAEHEDSSAVFGSERDWQELEFMETELRKQSLMGGE